MFGKQKFQFNIAYQHTSRTILATFGLVVLVCAYVITFGLFVGQVQPVEAAIPKYINFQGKLTAVSNGNNVANGTYAFEFKLYAASSGGSPLWTETWDGSSGPCPELTVAQGVFNTKLGACNSLASVDFTTGALYLSVNFDPGSGYDGEMSPRKQLVSSAFAFVANSVNGDGTINIANTGSNQATIGYDSTNKLQVNVASNGLTTLTANGAGAGINLMGGNVGIGDATPTALFTVGSGDLFQVASNGNLTSSNAGTWTFSNDTNIALSGGVNGLSFDSTTLSVDATNDRVGIGTAAPTGKLHIYSSGGLNSGINLEATSASSYGVIDFNTNAGLAGQFLATGSSFSNGIFTGDQLALANYLTNGSTTLVAGGANGYINFATGGYLAGNERMRINSTGQVGIANTSPSALLTLGTAGTTAGTLSMAGSTSGVITIQPQAAAGTYNFNLPTTAGSSGYVLTSGGGGASPMTWTDPSGLGVRWNAIINPTGTQTLAFDDGELNAWTVSSDTETFQTITANSLTTGTLISASSSSLSSGSLVNLAVSGTAAASNTQKVLNISTSGANATSTQTTYGGFFSNTHTGTSSTNVAGYFNASGGTNNYAIIVPASGGNVGIGTSTPTNLSGAYFGADQLNPLWVSANDAAKVTALVVQGNLGEAIQFVDQSGTAEADFGVYTTDLYFVNRQATGNIRFDINGSNALYIDSNRNVGIGTGVSAPGSRLEVKGASGQLSTLIGDAGYGTGYAGLSVHGVLSAGNYSLLGDATNLYINRPTGGDISIRENNATQLTIKTSTGNLGIGTAAPGEKLEVYAASPVARLRSSSAPASSTAYLEFGGSSAGVWSRTGYVGKGTGSNSDIYLLAESGGGLNLGTNGTQAVYINSSGNVELNYGSASTPVLTFTSDTNTGIFRPGADSLAIATGGTERLTVDSSGRVGIMNTSPSALLTLGTAGTTAGTLSMAGSTSGTITIQPQAAAGTYNFNLPTTAGTSGYVLTSAGGGASPMTWTDPSGLGVRWNSIIAPTGNLSLAHGANTTAFTFNSVTTGTAMALSSSSLTTGSLLSLTSTSTATSGTPSLFNITSSGANAGSGVTKYGQVVDVSNTGSTSINYGGSFSASGATSNTGLAVYGQNGTFAKGIEVSAGGATSTNIGINVAATGTATTNTGLIVSASGATNNYAALFSAGNVGIGDSTPASLLTVGSGDLFQVNSSGAIAASVGITTAGGAVSLNNNSNFATSISTGTNNTLTTIGGGSGTFSLQTTNIDISSAGAITNATGFNGLVVTANTGVITTGTWNGSVITGTYGGTGVNNGASTITLGGNLITSGAFATTLTSTATTNVTLPTSGTLYGTATGSITSNQLLTSLTDETGSGLAVFGTNPTFSASAIFTGLTASSAVYTDGSKSLTSTAPTSGAIGYWSRASTTLSPTTANDVLSVANTTTTGADLALTNTGVYTGTGVFNLTANSATTGTLASIAGNGMTTGNLLSLSSSSAAALTGQTGLNVALTGALTGAQTTYGAQISNTRTGASAVNYALQLTASGATAANYALSTTAGNVYIGSGNLQLVRSDSAQTIQMVGGNSGLSQNGDFSLNVGGASREFALINNNASKYILFVPGGSGTGNSNVGINTTTPGNYNQLRVLQNDATASQTRTAISAEATGAGATSVNVGLYATATGATNNYAAIFDAGNVGIGTTAPATTLQINSTYTSALNPGVRIRSNNPGISFDGTASGSARNFTIMSGYSTDTKFELLRSSVAQGTPDTVVFNVDGTTGFIGMGSSSTAANRIDVNGSLSVGGSYYGIAAPSNGLIVQGTTGIGTSGPDRKLDVLDASSPQIRLTTTDGSVYSDLQNTATANLTVTGSSLVSTSGMDYGMRINPTVNQASGSAGYTGLFMNTTETALGSGTYSLMDLQRGGSSYFRVAKRGGIISELYNLSWGGEIPSGQDGNGGNGVYLGEKTGGGLGLFGAGISLNSKTSYVAVHNAAADNSVIFGRTAGLVEAGYKGIHDRQLYLQGNSTDGASAEGVRIQWDANVATPNAGAKIATFGFIDNSDVYQEKMTVMANGSVGIANTSPSALLTLGTAGTTAGTLSMAGSTSGVITIQPQAAAGTYNFNLPTTAGSSGYVLTSAGGGATAMTWTDPAALGVRWNALTAPSGNLSLAHGANTTAFTFNSVTTGTAFGLSSSSLSSGTLFNLAVTGTAAASSTQKAINISTSGANATSSQTTYGGYFSNSHTGTSSTNVSLYSAASGGTTNKALQLDVVGGTDTVGIEIDSANSAPGTTSHTGIDIDARNFYGTTTTIRGINILAGPQSAGVGSTTVTGLQLQSGSLNVGGTVATAYGIDASLTSNNSAAITTGSIIRAYAADIGTGTYGTLYGLNLSNWSALSATTTYGIYMDTSIDQGSTRYALYSSATSNSYMAGNLGLGDTSPAALLTVGSGDLFQVASNGNLTSSNAGTWTFSNDTNIALSGGVNGLSFDTDVLSIDATNNRVGIGTTVPSEALEIGSAGNISLTSGYIYQKANGRTRYYNSANSNYAEIYNTSTGGSATLSITDGTGTGIRLDGSGNVGINTTGPDRKLDVLDASSPQLRLTQADGTVYSDLQTDSSGYLNMTATGHRVRVVDNYNGANSFYVLNSTTGTSASNNVIVGQSTAGDQIFQMGYANTTNSIYGSDIGILTTGTGATGGILMATQANAPISFSTNGLSNPRLTILGGGNVGVGDATPASLFTVGSGDLFQVNTTGDIFGNMTTLNGSTTAVGSGSNSTNLNVSSDNDFDIGNYVKVDPVSGNCSGSTAVCYAKIVDNPSANQLTISPALTWDNGASVVEMHVPEVGGINTSEPLVNRYGRGYFIDGIVAGNGSTYFSDGGISQSLASSTFNFLNNGNTTTLNLGTSATTVNIAGALSVASGDLTIAAKGDATDGGYTLTNSAAGTFGSETNRDGISSFAIFNGKLYAATSEGNASSVYRYDGGTTWTKVTDSTSGKVISGDTANIDAMELTVFNGKLWAGTQTGSNVGALYSYNGSSWSLVNATRGTFGPETDIDGVSDLVVYGGALYIATQEANNSYVYIYNGGTTITNVANASGQCANSGDMDSGQLAVYDGKLFWGVSTDSATAKLCVYQGDSLNSVNFRRVHSSDGTFISGGTSGINEISALAVHNGRLYIGTGINNSAEIYSYVSSQDGNDYRSEGFNEGGFTLTTATAGRIDATNDTTSIDAIGALRDYNGRLYAASYTGASLGALYEFNDSSNSWSLIGTRGTVGSQTNVDNITALIGFNGTLYLGTDEGNIGSVYSWNKSSTNSYALKFDSGSNNYATISFVGNQTGDSSADNMGSFLFSHSIVSTTGAYDLAEDYPTREQGLVAGDVLSLDPNETSLVKRSTTAYDRTVVGIYSTNPGIRLSQEEAAINGLPTVPVALAGRVPVNIAPDSLPIAPGDFLVSSGTYPGKAMKGTQAGAAIGKALEGWTPGTAQTQVMTLVNLSWNGSSIGASSDIVLQAASDTAINISDNTGSTLFNVNTNTRKLTIGTAADSAELELFGNIIVRGDAQIEGSIMVESVVAESVVAEEVTAETITSETVTAENVVADLVQVSGNNISENYESLDDSIEAGEVVVIDNSEDALIARADVSGSNSILGVVVEESGLELGSELEEGSGNTKYSVALIGRAQVKVSNENGEIMPGDFLANSDTIPGAAMKAIKSGAIIGQALETFTGGVGKIDAFIKPSNYNGLAIENQLAGLTFDYSGTEEGLINSAQNSTQILEYLISQLPSLDSENLSQISTDVVVANGEIITPTVTTQTLRADFLSSATSDGGLSVASTTMFNGGLTVDTISAIGDLLSFSSDVEFFGTPYFTSDTAGFAVVKAGVQSVDVTFTREYLAQPIVNASISFEQDVDQELLDEEAREVLKNDSIAAAQTFLAEGITYVVTNKSKFGFTIVLNKPAPSDVKMSWTALAVRNATTFMSIDTPSGFVAGANNDDPGVGGGGSGDSGSGEGSGDSGTPPPSDPPAENPPGDTPPSGDTPPGDGGGETTP